VFDWGGHRLGFHPKIDYSENLNRDDAVKIQITQDNKLVQPVAAAKPVDPSTSNDEKGVGNGTGGLLHGGDSNTNNTNFENENVIIQNKQDRGQAIIKQSSYVFWLVILAVIALIVGGAILFAINCYRNHQSKLNQEYISVR